MNLYTQLNFGGNCEEAFRFYEKNLGGKITMIMRKRDLPPGARAPDEPDDKVIHIRMDLAGVELIGNDVPAQHFDRSGARICISLSIRPKRRNGFMPCCQTGAKSV